MKQSVSTLKKSERAKNIKNKEKLTKRNCYNCNIEYLESNRYVKYRLKVNKETRFYCGQKCANEGLKSNVEQTCVVCGKKVLLAV